MKAQDNEVKQKAKWNYLRVYVGVLPGFEVYKKESALVTAALPTGINFRHYSSKIRRAYLDADLSNTVLVLQGSRYTSFAKIAPGAGITTDFGGLAARSYNIHAHISYMHSFRDNGNMIGVGYDVETQSVPISVEYLKYLELGTHYMLIGIKLPIVDFKLW